MRFGNTTILLIAFFLFSCGTNNHQENIPDINLAKEFGIDSTQLVYQYYQKYGFTDVCEDLRMVSKVANSPQLKKELPISTQDLKKIHSFSNKVDSITGPTLSFQSNSRNSFYDIELEFTEFITDSNLTLRLQKGKYEVTQTDTATTLKIYDQESGFFYIEVHRCSGY